MILFAVAVRTIDHHALAQPLLGEPRRHIADVCRVVVRTGLLPAAKNHVTGVVAGRLEDRRHALLGHRREPVRRARRQHRVDRGGHAAVRAVLEADRHRQPRGELAMDLALGRARADRDPRRQVGDVLRNLDVEKLGGRRQPEIVDVEQQFAREAQPLVDVEALVQIRVVDQSLPADRCARLLEVGAHDDDQVIGIARSQARQPFAILERRRRVVDGTGPGDHDEPRVLSLQRVGNRRPRCRDDVGRPFADRDLLVKDRRRDQRPHLPDAEIVGFLEHTVTNSSKTAPRLLGAGNDTRAVESGPMVWMPRPRTSGRVHLVDDLDQ